MIPRSRRTSNDASRTVRRGAARRTRSCKTFGIFCGCRRAAPVPWRHGHLPPSRRRAARRSARGASEQIAVEIRRWLEEQRLQPGERIGTEQEMADEFGVSRPTLREALRLLSASHLIRVGRGRRRRVRGQHAERGDEPERQRVDLADAGRREHLDGRAARRAALARGAARRPRGAQRRRRGDRAARGGDRRGVGHQPGTRAVQRADSRFHQILAEAAGNDLLRALTAWILEVLQPSLVARIAGRVEPRRSSPSTARSSARCAGTSARRPRRRCGAHRVPGRRPKRIDRGSRVADRAPPRGRPLRRAGASASVRSHSWMPHAAVAERDPQGHRHAVDAVLAREDHRRGPQVAARWPEQRGDHAGDHVARRPGRGPARVQRHVARVPVADEVLGGRALLAGKGHRLAVDAHAVEQRDAGFAVLADHPGVHAAGRDPERVADRRPQPQRVVGRVADHAAAVEPPAPLDPGGEGVDRVRDHHDGRVGTDRRGDLVDDPGVVAQVDHARAVDGERRGGRDHDDRGVRDRLGTDDADRAGRTRGDHLLEVHLVRDRHA